MVSLFRGEEPREQGNSPLATHSMDAQALEHKAHYHHMTNRTYTGMMYMEYKQEQLLSFLLFPFPSGEQVFLPPFAFSIVRCLSHVIIDSHSFLIG